MPRSYTAFTTKMVPQLGDTISSRDLGFKHNETYIWHACIVCGEASWRRLVYLKQGKFLRCKKCGDRSRIGKPVKDRMRHIQTTQGYIQIRKPEYHRADKHGYVMEHIFVWETFHQKQ